MKKLWILAILGLLSGCTGTPKNIEPVPDFELDRYLGTWYEIARLDHSFERGLDRVTAEYSMREDGGVRVINRGYSEEEKEFRSAEGKAYFVGDSATGHLKVSFFGPFYGSYVIFELDTKYQFAFITSYNQDYLWLLARAPTVTGNLKENFLSVAKSKGYAVDQLIWVRHFEQQEK